PRPAGRPHRGQGQEEHSMISPSAPAGKAHDHDHDHDDDTPDLPRWLDNPAGRPSAFIRPFHVNPGDKFVVLTRVSSSQQGADGNLLAQDANLRRAVKERGGRVVGGYAVAWSGRGPGWADHLLAASDFAERHNATLLAAT